MPLLVGGAMGVTLSHADMKNFAITSKMIYHQGASLSEHA